MHQASPNRTDPSWTKPTWRKLTTDSRPRKEMVGSGRIPWDNHTLQSRVRQGRSFFTARLCTKWYLNLEGCCTKRLSLQEFSAVFGSRSSSSVSSSIFDVWQALEAMNLQICTAVKRVLLHLGSRRLPWRMRWEVLDLFSYWLLHFFMYLQLQAVQLQHNRLSVTAKLLRGWRHISVDWSSVEFVSQHIKALQQRTR